MILLMMIVYGICLSFFGYKIYKVATFLGGLLAGWILSIFLVDGFFATLVLGIILSLMLGVLSVVMIRVGVFLQCFVCGFLMIMIPSFYRMLLENLNTQRVIEIARNWLVNGSIGIDIYEDLPIAIIVGVIMGVVGLIFTKIVIIVVLSLTGGILTAAGLLPIGMIAPICVIVGIGVAVGGALYQFNRLKLPMAKPPMAKPPMTEIVAPMPVKKSFCSQCGTECNEKMLYCPRCGKQLSGMS